MDNQRTAIEGDQLLTISNDYTHKALFQSYAKNALLERFHKSQISDGPSTDRSHIVTKMMCSS